MRMIFGYTLTQEDEGMEEYLAPVCGCVEETNLTNMEYWTSDNFNYLRITFDNVEKVDILLNKIQKIITTKWEEVIEFSKLLNLEESSIFIKVNKKEVSFIAYGENDFVGAVPTEFYILFLQAWRDYLASGIQEERIVNIHFDFDRELYRKTGLIRKSKKSSEKWI